MRAGSPAAGRFALRRGSGTTSPGAAWPPTRGRAGRGPCGASDRRAGSVPLGSRPRLPPDLLERGPGRLEVVGGDDQLDAPEGRVGELDVDARVAEPPRHLAERPG